MNQHVDKAEHCLIDQLIDNGSCPAGYMNYQTVRQLYTKGFLYFDVTIEDDDYVIVPPLEVGYIFLKREEKKSLIYLCFFFFVGICNEPSAW